MIKNKCFWDLKENYKFVQLEIYEVIGYSIIGFFLPFFIGHPQWLIGIIVNIFLMKSAINFKLKSAIPLIILPSLGVLSAGVIFNKFSYFLIYFIPIIWVSNLSYILSYKYLRYIKNIISLYSLTISSLIKTGILFSFSLIMVYLFNFPKLFLIVMGPIQLFTSFVGGFLSIFLNKLIKKV